MEPVTLSGWWYVLNLCLTFLAGALTGAILAETIRLCRRPD